MLARNQVEVWFLTGVKLKLRPKNHPGCYIWIICLMKPPTCKNKKLISGFLLMLIRNSHSHFLYVLPIAKTVAGKVQFLFMVVYNRLQFVINSRAYHF